MSIAACLLLYSLAVIVAGPPLLRRLTRSGHAPGLGVATWVAAIGSVLISWAAAAVLVLVDVARHWHHPDAFAASCLSQLWAVAAGHAGIGSQIALLTIATAATAATTVIGTRLVWTTMHLRGRVTRKYVGDDGAHLLDVELWSENDREGVTTPATATVMSSAAAPRRPPSA